MKALHFIQAASSNDESQARDMEGAQRALDSLCRDLDSAIKDARASPARLPDPAGKASPESPEALVRLLRQASPGSFLY